MQIVSIGSHKPHSAIFQIRRYGNLGNRNHGINPLQIAHIASINKVYDNYFCQQRNRKGVEYCDRKFTSVEMLDSAVIQILKQIKLDKSIIDNYVYEEENIGLAHRTRDDVQQDINKIEYKISNLTNTLGNNSRSSAAKYIVTEIEKLDRQLSGLKYELLEIDSIEHKHSKIQHDKEAKYNLVCEIVDNLETADYDDINELIKELFKECVWDGENLHIKI